MQAKLILIFIFFIFFVSSCRNYEEYKYITKNFEKKYTGLDTLIRLDGYYYKEYYDTYTEYHKKLGLIIDTVVTYRTIVFSKNSEYNTFCLFRSHKEIQSFVRDKPYCTNYGFYTLLDDTIKTQWSARANLNSWVIFYSQYLIENDTTLKLISHFGNSGYAFEQNPLRNEIYKFYKYP